MREYKCLIESYEPGATAPPFHCYCRSLTAPYFDDEFTIGEKRAARGEDGKTYYVPSDMSYKEWLKINRIKSIGIPDLENRPNKYVVKKLMNGEFGSKINLEKQKPHIESTKLERKSYLFDNVDPQSLFNKYAGTGIMETTNGGKLTNKEVCIAEYNVGIDGRSKKVTNMFKIHHSKNRTHISPCLRKEQAK